MFSAQASVHHHQQHQRHRHQQHQQQQHQHHHYHQQQQQKQKHPGNAYDREEAEDLGGRRDFCCYLGDLGKNAQHTLKQGGVERALEFREAAAAAAASDLGGIHDEWLSAVDDSMAMLFDDDAATATIRLELVGAAAPSSSLSSRSSSSSSLSSEGAEAAVAEPPAAATITAMAAAPAMAVAEVASTPDQTRDFFLSMMTGHGGDSAADWLADVGGGGSQGRVGGMDMGIGVGVGGGIGLGVGCADDPPCMLIGGDEMLLPPEARPPWEKATTARSRFVTCESVLPLPKPQQQAQKKNLGPRQRFPASKSDQANSRQSSTGRPRRGAGLPR